MKHHKSILASGALIAVAVIVVLATQSYGDFAPDESSALLASEDSASLDKAGFSFAVTELSRSGHDVTFTIAKDAHAMEKKADAVVLSGLYDSGKGKSDDCPVVDSTAVEKSVEDYDPISGKARVKAHFDDEAVAQAAIEKGCLLINDPR